MRFSEYYSVEQDDSDDWYDTFLPADTNLAVDPFLIYEDKDPRWNSAHQSIVDFFGVIFHLIHQANGNNQSMAWKKAQALLLFPEPSEFCLGVAEGSPLGSGAGKELQQGMLDGIQAAVGLGIENISHMEMLALFQGGMGIDRISDSACNILKSDFIKYTQDVCNRHGVPMETFRVKNARWSDDLERWQEADVMLPLNPFPKRRHPVLLVPQRFLRDIPVANANEFWRYAWRNHGDDLRNDFNWDIAQKVPRSVKARMARQRPRILQAYLSKLEEEQHDPYDMTRDPKLLVNWYEAGEGIASRSDLSFIPESASEFGMFIKSVVEAYQHSVENQDGWYLLWAAGKPRPERAAQALFRSMVLHYCRANNIDLTGESNAGRGPVDFKFSQGWNARALVEVKLAKNSQFWDGILAQTPEYAIAEEVKIAIFVVIAFSDKDLEPDRTVRTREAGRIASELNSIQVDVVTIDARTKISASKKKMTREAREKLEEFNNQQATTEEDEA